MGVLSGFGAILVEVLGEDVVDYWHKRTDETLEGITALYKDKLQVTDPVGGRTSYQKVPRFRIADLPWPEGSLAGDTITTANGNVWKVDRADTLPTGVTTCYVQQISRPPVTP